MHFLICQILGKRLRIFQVVDDTLGIVHTHMVAGFLGGFMTGILATVEGCAAFGISNPGGAVAGNGRQVWVQIVGALFVIGWNLVWTPLILYFIKFVLRVPLRMSEADLLIGDDAAHGEGAYTFDEVPLLHRHGEPSHVNVNDTHAANKEGSTSVPSDKEDFKNGTSSGGPAVNVRQVV